MDGINDTTELALNITVEKDYDASQEPLGWMPQEISRVFLNRLNNARYPAHHRTQGEEGSKSTLWAQTNDVSDRVEIFIKDNGTGILKEVLNEIYEPLITTKPTDSGTAVGLLHYL
ncbi:hypothetical protein CMK14_26410 [Candidatus Poribacteria bacterium]|nr:hypothetical protein [Candidatus Poribacteria bacterium]